MTSLTEQQLLELIQSGESNTVELKIAAPRPSEIAERMAGLANAQGGYMIFGVEDTNLEIVGVSDLKGTIDTILRGARQVQPPVILSPSQPEVFTLDSKKLVVATVPASTGPVYQASGIFWLRTGTHSVPLTYQQLVEMGHQRGVLSWERQSGWNATLNDLDLEKVKNHLMLRSTRPQLLGKLEKIEEVLIEMGCATLTSDGLVKPTNAGLLFFGTSPQVRVPQGEIICVVFPDKLALRRYLDRKILTGTLTELIDQAEDFLQKNIEVGAKVVGWRRVDLPAYNLESLREAVVNAVIHRDYSREGETVRVLVYPNRIEIRSPGTLLPGLTIQQLQRGLASSRLRNPLMGNLLRDIPGYFERVGSGVRFMLEESVRLNLPVPEFREINSEILVTFYNSKERLEAGDETARDRTRNNEQLPVQADHITAKDEELEIAIKKPVQKKVVEEETFSQEQRLVMAMKYVQEHGSITTGQYMDLTGVSDRTALRDLELLLKEGSLRRVGKTRSSHYELP
jgi:ATP-dependent DNA helicase RecG